MKRIVNSKEIYFQTTNLIPIILEDTVFSKTGLNHKVEVNLVKRQLSLILKFMMFEKFYFQYEPNSESEADFKEIGLELKSSPLKQLLKPWWKIAPFTARPSIGPIIPA